MAELDRRQFLVGTAGGAILLRLPPEASGVSKRALRELRSAVRGRVLVPRDSTADRLQPPLRGPAARRGGPRGEHGRRGGGGALGGPLRRARGGPLRRPQLRGLFEHGRRRGARPLEAAGGAGGGRPRHGRSGRAADRRAARADPAGPHRPVRLVPVGGHRRPRAGRRARPRRAPLRPHERQPARGAHRDRGWARAARGRRHERGSLLGVPRRGRRQLRDRDRADPEDTPGARRGVVQRLVAVVPG